MERVKLPLEISEEIIDLLKKAYEYDELYDSIDGKDLPASLERLHYLALSNGYNAQVWEIIRSYRKDLFHYHYSLEGNAKDDICLVLENLLTEKST